MSPAGVVTVLHARVLAATPSPTTVEAPPDDLVGPGVAGFLATAAVVVVSILVIMNMVGRLRRMEHRRLDDERSEDVARRRAGQDGPPDPPGTGPPDADPRDADPGADGSGRGPR